MSTGALLTRGQSGGRIYQRMRGNRAAYKGLSEPPPSGYQYQTYLGSGAGDWLGAGSVPAVLVGDVFIVSKTTAPTGWGTTADSDGTLVIASGGLTTRQRIAYEIFRAASNSIDGPANVWDNEVPPIWSGPVLFPQLQLTVTMDPVNLNNYASSPEGDGLTFSIATGGLPPGITLNPTTGIVSGTPISDDGQGNTNSFPFSFFATDSAGTVGTSQSIGTSITVNPQIIPPPPPSGPMLLAPAPDTAGAQIDAQIAVLQALVNANTNDAVQYALEQQLNQMQVEAVSHYMATGWANAAAILALFPPAATDVVGQRLAARVAFLLNLYNNAPAMPPGNANGYGGSGWTTVASAYAQKLYAAQTTLVQHIMDCGSTTAATIISNMTGSQTNPAGIPFQYRFTSVGFTDADQDD